MSRGPHKLFIGPYAGEFGVEVLRWQGIARALAKSRHWQRVYVCGDPSREFLYRDFCSEYVAYSAPSEHALGYSCHGTHPEAVHEEFIDLARGDVWLSPKLKAIQRFFLYGQTACRSEFRNFSQGIRRPKKPYDILIHARATTKAGQDFKNWPVAAWEALVRRLPKTWRVASIGSKKGAHKITGTADLRDIPLERLAGYCGAAQAIVGPSSGAIHFAMHCGTAAVTWIDQDPKRQYSLDHARCNYYPQWNPFDVPFACMTGWQPEPGLVAFKVRELAELVQSRNQPIEYAVFGTKRSGHHAVIEWIAGLRQDRRFTHWNDCIAQGFETFPPEEFTVPTRTAAPKMLHQAAPFPSIHTWNENADKEARLLSFESVPIEKIPSLPEAQHAKKLVFVLRDGLNLAASLKAGIPELREASFLHAQFRALLAVYRGYLLEAVGKTDCLRNLRAKTIFVSYNRWHLDAEYRAQVASALGAKSKGQRPEGMSVYSHRSGFEEGEKPAAELRTLSRWQHFFPSEGLWNLACDPEIFAAEQEFHGGFTPMGLDFPTTGPAGIPLLPSWALQGWPTVEEAGVQI